VLDIITKREFQRFQGWEALGPVYKLRRGQNRPVTLSQFGYLWLAPRNANNALIVGLCIWVMTSVGIKTLKNGTVDNCVTFLKHWTCSTDDLQLWCVYCTREMKDVLGERIALCHDDGMVVMIYTKDERCQKEAKTIVICR
jgi:hypothetical protein